jgi:tetratricopeptide (TPR) repeat protein
MKHAPTASVPHPARRAAAALALCMLPALSGTAHAVADGELDDLWRDPGFRRQFTASYGINSDIEPRLSPKEIELLEEILPLMSDDLPAAEAALLDAIEPDSSASLDCTLGNLRFQQDRLAEARADFERAVGKFPAFRRAWRNLGLIHARDGRYDDAIGAFTRMIELGGGDGYSYGLLGYAYASKADYQAAEAAYRNALLLQPDSTEWRLGLTRCVFKQEKFQDAAALLEALVARYPDNADFWLLQAHTFVGMQQPLRAAGNFEAIDQLGKSTTDGLFTLGDLYLSEDLPDLAAGAYRRAIDRDPAQLADRPLRSAEMLAARGAVDQARAVAGHIQATRGEGLLAADRSRLLKLQARLSMSAGEGSAETARVLEEIIALDPLDGEALMLLGQHHERQDEPDRAIFCYERAASLPDYEANALIRNGQVLVRQSRYAEALPLLRRAQEVRPRDDVARYLEQVERLARSQG